MLCKSLVFICRRKLSACGRTAPLHFSCLYPEGCTSFFGCLQGRAGFAGTAENAHPCPPSLSQDGEVRRNDPDGLSRCHRRSQNSGDDRVHAFCINRSQLAIFHGQVVGPHNQSIDSLYSRNLLRIADALPVLDLNLYGRFLICGLHIFPQRRRSVFSMRPGGRNSLFHKLVSIPRVALIQMNPGNSI